MSTLVANRVESCEALREATAAMGEAKAALRAAEATALSAGAAFSSIDALWKEGAVFDREFCDLSTAASAQQVEELGLHLGQG